MNKLKLMALSVMLVLGAFAAGAGTGKKADGTFNEDSAITYRTNSAGTIIGCEKTRVVKQKCKSCNLGNYVNPFDAPCDCVERALSTNVLSAPWNSARTNILTDIKCWTVTVTSAGLITNFVNVGTSGAICSTNYTIVVTPGHCGNNYE